MRHPLDGIEAKLTRAEAHFNAIKKAVERITKRDPDLIPGEFDRHEHRYIFRAPRDSTEGDWLSPVIGDCVHNFRAALDYIAWELSSPTYRASHAKWIEFPIFTDPRAFELATKKIGGLEPKAQTVIKCLQPFSGPDCRPRFDLAHPMDTPLWQLYELDNWDKHRALNLTEHLASLYLLGFEQLGVTVPPDPIKIGGPFKRGAPLVYTEMPFGNPEVHVDLKVAYDITFDLDGPESVRAEPVVKALDNIRREIRRRVLPSLIRFFPRR
jgi:hypothetical protein